VFDNLFWLGTRQHSSWALQTSAGIIIIDTNFAWATEPEIIEGLTRLGLNPSDIKYVLISHAHGDHDQGAAELQKRYDAKVVMGAPDWESTLQRPATAAGGVPKRDVAVGPEGMTLNLGDVSVQIVATPGHTPGTLSYVFPVRDQGRTLMVAYSGGTLTGAFGADGARWDEYSASQRKISKVAADAGASVLLSNHSEYDGACTRAAPAPRPSANRGKPSLHRRCRRRTAILHRDGRMRNGIQTPGGREIASSASCILMRRNALSPEAKRDVAPHLTCRLQRFQLTGAVGLAEIVARIGHRKCSVLPRGNLDQVSGRVVAGSSAAATARRGLGSQDAGDGGVILHVRHENGRGIFESDIVRPMQLPEIFQSGRLMQHSERIGRAAFARAVVHHRNTRLQCVHQRRGS
jgi:glyoxylase-like metal-dependent hydrolase (beta-lactamase superfamily II)